MMDSPGRGFKRRKDARMDGERGSSGRLEADVKKKQTLRMGLRRKSQKERRN